MALAQRHEGGGAKRRWLPLLALACLLAAPAHADERQNKIEAAFLYNFFNYITWPGYATPDAMKQATICLDGSDAVEPYLYYIRNKHLPEHSLTVRTATPESIDGCQILFLRNIDAATLARLRTTALEKGVLLISDTPNFIEDGGMIGLSHEDGRIAMEIDNSMLKAANFQVSSRLLSLASKVK